MEYLTQLELGLPADIWRPFVADRPAVRCSTGYLIYMQNTEATCFYYLKQGRVKSFIQSADGAERVLHIYHQGSLFGEASFFDEQPRVSSAVALAPCELIPIDRELVTLEFSKNPELALAMLKYLARTVRMLSDQVDDMAFRPATWRVARFLTTRSKNSAPLAYTQDEIAASVSTSRVTVSRILNQFARDGLIENGYRNIEILNSEELEALCQPQ